MYIRRKVFSLLNVDGEERYFSTTDFELEDRYFAKKDESHVGRNVALGGAGALGLAAAADYAAGLAKKHGDKLYEVSEKAAKPGREAAYKEALRLSGKPIDKKILRDIFNKAYDDAIKSNKLATQVSQEEAIEMAKKALADYKLGVRKEDLKKRRGTLAPGEHNKWQKSGETVQKILRTPGNKLGEWAGKGASKTEKKYIKKGLEFIQKHPQAAALTLGAAAVGGTAYGAHKAFD